MKNTPAQKASFILINVTELSNVSGGKNWTTGWNPLNAIGHALSGVDRGQSENNKSDSESERMKCVTKGLGAKRSAADINAICGKPK